jgi:hypothetical protein
VCLADSPRVQCSTRVHRVRARLRFRSGFVLGFCCSRFADSPSFSSGWSGPDADGPPVPCGQSVFPGASLVVLLAFTDCRRHLAGLSAWPLQTVRPCWSDSPPVLGSFAPWFDSSLLSFVLPRVFQGIVPKTLRRFFTGSYSLPPL